MQLLIHQSMLRSVIVGIAKIHCWIERFFLLISGRKLAILLLGPNWAYYSREVLQHEITAYYDDFEIIKKAEVINDNYQFNDSQMLKVKSMTDIEVHRHKEFIKARTVKK